MESTRCPLCGGDDARAVVRTRDWSHGLPGEFTYVRCRRCGLVYLNPRPTDLAAYYPPDYSEYRATPIDDEPSWWRRVNRRYGMRKRTRLITDRLPPGRVLDVGCGAGVFLHEMKRLGWRAQGEDTSPDAVRAARGLGLDVFEGELAEARFPEASFDAVTLWNVVEHLPDPLAQLREVARVTRTGGVVVMTTPNVQSAEARIFGGRWAMWEAPRHLQLFSPSTVSQALAAAGFVDAQVSFTLGAWWGFATSLQYALEAAHGVRHDPSRPRTYADAYGWTQPVRLLAQPYLFLLDRAGLGSTMTVVATRRDGR